VKRIFITDANGNDFPQLA